MATRRLAVAVGMLAINDGIHISILIQDDSMIFTLPSRNRLARGPRDGGSSGSRGNGRRRGGSGAPRREPKKPKTVGGE